MTTGRAPHHQSEQDPADTVVVRRGLHALGWSRPSSVVRRLSDGDSGSQVFLLDAGDERFVLKVTEDDGWLPRARRELSVYRQLGSTGGSLPRLRAAHVDQHAVRLLLDFHDPHPPATALAHDTWVLLADRLGQLHRTPLARSSGLSRRARPSPEQVADALRRWTGRGSGRLAARAAAELAAADGAGLDLVLTHGDCHLGNLLQGPEGRTLWIDWQDVCLSHGLDDLVFLWQRAEFDGATPPRDEMTAAYVAARSLPLDGAFRTALAASELRLLLVAWPPFLAYGSPERQHLMTRRLRQLVDGPDA